MIYGVDNGVTGSIATIDSDGKVNWYRMPVKVQLDYTNKKQYISRIDIVKLRQIFSFGGLNNRCAIERPMINPTRLKLLYLQQEHLKLL